MRQTEMMKRKTAEIEAELGEEKSASEILAAGNTASGRRCWSTPKQALLRRPPSLGVASDRTGVIVG